MTAKLRVATFNILAPCWAHPKWYHGQFLQQLDPAYRRPRIRAQLAALAEAGTEIFCLQETQPAEVQDLFGSGGLQAHEWLVFEVAHAPNYWQNWWITSPSEIALAPWTADHTNHGVALLVKKSSFSEVRFSKILASTGNGQALMTALYQGQRIAVASVHYDSDSSANRQTELEATLAALPPDAQLSVIGGDFNADTNSGNLQGKINSADFVDLLYAFGLSEPTHPFSTTYYRSFNYAIIDHLLARGGLSAVPPTCVINNNLYGVYPAKPPPDMENERIAANFELLGSDHFPVFTTLVGQ